MKKFLSILSVLSVIGHILWVRRFSSECDLNSGIAFGVDIQYVEYITILLILLLFIFSLYIKGVRGGVLSSIAIFGFGNWINRIYTGCICDYISLFDISFNILDMGILIMVVIGIISFIRHDDTNNSNTR